MSDVVPAQLCIEVTGAGQLCGDPCRPGYVRCKEHSDVSDRRSTSQVLEAARNRVLVRMEEKADDLAAVLFDLMSDPDVAAGVRLDAIGKAFQVLGMDKIQVQVETRDTTPGKTARDNRLLDLLERAGSPDRANQVRAALGVIETTAQ